MKTVLITVVKATNSAVSCLGDTNYIFVVFSSEGNLCSFYYKTKWEYKLILSKGEIYRLHNQFVDKIVARLPSQLRHNKFKSSFEKSTVVKLGDSLIIHAHRKFFVSHVL